MDTHLSHPAFEQVPQRFAWFQQMRASQPVYCDEETHVWHVFRYEDVSRVLTDHAYFSSNLMHAMTAASTPAIEPPMILMDPPGHRHLRSLITQAFTPRSIAQLAPRITTLVQELLDQVRANGKMDVIKDVAFPLTATVIAELLGVPAEDRDTFKVWSDATVANPFGGIGGQRSQTEAQGDSASHSLPQSNYFLALFEERRQHPQQDLMSRLLTAEIDGERLNTRQMLSFCILLLVAGHETTTSLLSNAILCFDEYPEVTERLRHEPSLLPNTIEEVLRYLPVPWYLYRITTKEVVLGGRSIPAGQPVCAWVASANRDGAQFPHPDQFDMRREPNRHLSFGHCVHFCIGAPLARLEAHIALSMMLTQLPGLKRVSDVPLETIDSHLNFGVKYLPITFTPS